MGILYCDSDDYLYVHCAAFYKRAVLRFLGL